MNASHHMTRPPRRLQPSGGVADWIGVDMTEANAVCAEPTRKYPEGRTGTSAGYQAHRKVREPACPECKEAERIKQLAIKQTPEYKQKRRAHYVANSAAYAAKNLMAKHGLTLEEYDVLLASQGGGCAVCGTTEPGGRGRFHVDHDHSCCPGEKSCRNCVRGLLCSGCNVGLGAFGDDVDRMTAAIAYLMTSREAVRG